MGYVTGNASPRGAVGRHGVARQFRSEIERPLEPACVKGGTRRLPAEARLLADYVLIASAFQHHCACRIDDPEVDVERRADVRYSKSPPQRRPPRSPIISHNRLRGGSEPKRQPCSAG